MSSCSLHLEHCINDFSRVMSPFQLSANSPWHLHFICIVGDSWGSGVLARPCCPTSPIGSRVHQAPATVYVDTLKLHILIFTCSSSNGRCGSGEVLLLNGLPCCPLIIDAPMPLMSGLSSQAFGNNKCLPAQIFVTGSEAVPVHCEINGACTELAFCLSLSRITGLHFTSICNAFS